MNEALVNECISEYFCRPCRDLSFLYHRTPSVETLGYSQYVKGAALMRADAAAIADWAMHHGFSIVSKDTDFYQRSVALGSPPKFIWLRVGNCATDVIVDLLRFHHTLIRDFIASEAESVLVSDRPARTQE